MDISPVPAPQLPGPIAGKKFGIRAGAYVIDTLTLIVETFFVNFCVGLVTGLIWALRGLEFRGEVQSANPIVNVIVAIALSIVYFTIFEWLYGATLGKIMLGLRVIKDNGEPCTIGAAIARGALRLIDGIFFGVPALLNMKPPLYQRLGDKAAKTVVVGSKDAVIRHPREWWWFVVAACLYLVIDIPVTTALVLSTFQ